MRKLVPLVLALALPVLAQGRLLVTPVHPVEALPFLGQLYALDLVPPEGARSFWFVVFKGYDPEAVYVLSAPAEKGLRLTSGIMDVPTVACPAQRLVATVVGGAEVKLGEACLANWIPYAITWATPDAEAPLGQWVPVWTAKPVARELWEKEPPLLAFIYWSDRGPEAMPSSRPKPSNP